MKTLRDILAFNKLHKNARTYMECPEEVIVKYEGVLPSIITNSWKIYGFEEMSSGFLWTVNPDEYREYVASFVYPEQLPDVNVIMRTGLGCMILQYRNKFVHFSAVTMRHNALDRPFELVLDLDLGERQFLNSIFFFDLFEKALKRLGPISEEEVYGLVPAPALGGTLDAEHLQKMNLASYLDYLAELQPEARSTLN